MIDLRGWARGGVRLTTLALIGLMNVGCPNEEGTTTGSGGNDGGGGQGGTPVPGGGGSGGAMCVPEQEICDQKDNDCNGQVDDVPGLTQACACNDGEMQACYTGDPATDGVGTCKKGQQSCAGGTWGECQDQVTPASEQCNLEDDDCDGVVDDMGQASCGAGECAAVVEKCVDGALQTCVPGQPSEEVCDGKDNDCNGTTDEADPMLGQGCTTGSPGICSQGTLKCTAGALVCAGATPSAELCDGKDNDCNGTTDDVAGAGVTCSTGKLGVCAAGLVGCQQVGGGAYVVDCYSIVPPSAEVCDGLDNNCNGQTDENDPGGGATCDTGLGGVCQAGTEHCVAGSVQCVPNKAISPELCNGADDNCNGQIDEGDPGGGLGCFTGLDGVCGDGTTSCTGGMIVCNQTVVAGPEECNDLDDDCNGLVDDGNPGGGATCDTGLPGVCGPGTMTCLDGQVSCEQDVQPSAEICGNAIDENCDGVATGAVTVYFAETFADNSAGWTLDPEWAIGPTVSSAGGGSCGAGDPALDHTPTADNGVAGAVLGGNISSTPGGPYHLTSPIIDTSAAPTLYLEYWRWLHSDYPPYMVDTVQVYNGASWITVWSNPGNVVDDTQWVKMSHDVTAHKNANFRVRWSYQVASGAYLCAGWNVDDVQLVDAQCN